MKTTFLFLCVLFSLSASQAQKKSELLAQIENLNMELGASKDTIAKIKRAATSSKAASETLRAENEALRDANATLLKNLSGFAEISSKNSENVNKALASLDQKEQQLRGLNDAIAKNDSLAIVLLTSLKRTLGEDAKIAASANAIVVSLARDALFESDSIALKPTAGEAYLKHIAAMLNTYPDVDMTLETLSNTGELELAGHQAAIIATTLQKHFGIADHRLNTLGKDGGLREGILLKFHPDFATFYDMVKTELKN